MKLVFKIFKLAVILILAVSLLLFSASLLMQDKVADIILKSLNNSISTKFEYRSLRLSFLRRFPNASVELKNVIIHSSNSFKTSSLQSMEKDTLLTAGNLSVEFRLTDIINGNYTIESIFARGGRLNLFTDSTGMVNWNISDESTVKGDKDLAVNLEKINVRNINVFYNNRSAGLVIKGNIKNGILKSKIKGENIDFIALAHLEIERFTLGNTVINGPINTNVDLAMQSNSDGITFNKGTVSTNDYDLDLKGSVLRGNILDLTLTGQKIDITSISNYLPGKYRDFAREYETTGILTALCKIKGPFSRGHYPHIEASYFLKNGKLTSKNRHFVADNISFSGSLSNGSGNSSATGSFSMKDISWTLGSGIYKGSLSITNFNHPLTVLALKGRIFPEELKKYFNIKQISSAEGSADIDLSLTTAYMPEGKVSINDIVKLKPEGTIIFNSLSMGFNDDSLLLGNIKGSLGLSGNIKADGLNFLYKGQRISIDGDFTNLPEWFAGLPVNMEVSADIHMDRFIPGDFFSSASTSSKNNKENSKIRLPDNINLKINFNIDSIAYRKTKCSSISGSLNYRPRILTFNTVNMNTLNGHVTGSGFIVQDINRSVITRGNFIIENIDINKAFKSFNNFGQNFIKAENLAGRVSGSLSLMLPFDHLLNPRIKELTAEGKYTLVKGALIDFSPVKQLSSFIELSELENIHFEQLQNDFFIKNNTLFIPQMDVKSSAADLSVNGQHDFDNNFEYHVKVRLSEILSKKRKKSRNPVTEFGAVEDDGLGRTSLLLKIVNKGADDIKVSYDLKAAGSTVKNNIRKERQNLKTILNEEYGWYKSDTTVKTRPVEKKNRIRIRWDDSDTTYSVPDTVIRKKKIYTP